MKFAELCSSAKSIALVETKPRAHHRIWSNSQRVWQRCLNLLQIEESEFRVWFTRADTGEIRWSADNIRTSASIHDVPEDLIRQWIERQQQS